MSNHQRANGPSHHDLIRHHRDNHTYSDHRQLHESERRPMHLPQHPDPQSYSAAHSRPRQTRFASNDRNGYGGGAAFRGFHTPVPLRDLDQYSPYSSNRSPIRRPDQPHPNDPYSTKPRNLVDPSPTPTIFSNNSYTGGCPYMHNPNERKLPQPASLTLHHESFPMPNESHDAWPTSHRDATSLTGPYKSICSSVSPVKHRPSRPRVKTETSSFAVPSSSATSAVPSPPATALRARKSDRRLPSSAPAPIALSSNERLSTERRPNRTLSCEREETRTPHRTELLAPIAHPATVPTDTTNAVRQSKQAQQNGSLPKTIPQSNQAEMKYQSGEFGKSGLQTVERIFKKSPRIPKWPDEKLSAEYAPPVFDKRGSTADQVKDVSKPAERTNSEKKLPRLRSVLPTKNSKLGDAPLNPTRTRGLQLSHQEGHPGAIPKNDCNGLNGNRSPCCVSPGVPHDSEERRTINRHQQSGTRRNLTSSIANMNIADQNENGSASEREQSHADLSYDEKQRESSNKRQQDCLLRGGNRDSQVSKRRTTDFDGSHETRSKRQRPLPSSETVILDETIASRRSKRFQATDKKWETVAFDEVRVLNLFMEQLRNQPMLLRLSFLGISDGDLRKTVDIWRSEKDLPRPSYRRLEINNNRIRRISGDMCECIAALRAVSLNLSCNLLTTIEGKIGLCSRLKFLNVSRNQLSSLPQELCDLTNLEVLNMSHNDISRLPSGLCRLKHLEVLSLAWNKLEVLPEDVTTEGAVLSDLDLSHNEAFHFFPRCTEHWTKLEVLHLSCTTIYKSLSRRENRLRPAALVKELAGRKEDMFKRKRPGLRSQSL